MALNLFAMIIGSFKAVRLSFFLSTSVEAILFEASVIGKMFWDIWAVGVFGIIMEELSFVIWSIGEYVSSIAVCFSILEMP